MAYLSFCQLKAHHMLVFEKNISKPQIQAYYPLQTSLMKFLFGNFKDNFLGDICSKYA